MLNSKTEKRWNNNAIRSSSNKNKPTQATNSTTTSTVPNTFLEPPCGALYRLSSWRRKNSNHPETGSTTTARPFADLKDVAVCRPKTDDEGEVGKAHRSLDDQKEGTISRTNTNVTRQQPLTPHQHHQRPSHNKSPTMRKATVAGTIM